MENDKEPDEKSGLTLGEIEGKMRRYGLEIGLCVTFILTAIFTLIWGGAWVTWSILLSMILGVIGALMPKAIDKATCASLSFIYREKVTSIVVAVIAFLIAIILPPLIFAVVGLIAGKSFALDAQRKNNESCEHHEE